MAGAAALVIQAYRQAHGGATPTPALVKQILVSTASDIGAPADEQGAGLLNSYKAVQLAESIQTADGTPAPAGNTLLKSTGQLNAVALPGTKEHFPVTITNTGAGRENVSIVGRAIGPDRNVQTGSVTLNDSSSPQFTNYQGITNNYQTFTFNVGARPEPAGRLDRLPGQPGQGEQPAGPADPDHPGRPVRRALAAAGRGQLRQRRCHQPGRRYLDRGDLQRRVHVQRHRRHGPVAGRDAAVQAVRHDQPRIRVAEGRPEQDRHGDGADAGLPGDSSASIVFSTGFDADTSTIPVTLRSEVDVAGGGTFSGTLTGGNGRPNGEGQVDYYEFNVGAGVNNITTDVSLTNDAGDPVGAYLVDPNGNVAGYGQNSINGSQGTSLTAWAVNPIQGTWTLIVDFAEPVAGDEVSQPFTGSVAFNAVSVSAAGMPDSAGTTLPAGQPVTVPVTITNNGEQAEDFFVDPRLSTSRPPRWHRSPRRAG